MCKKTILHKKKFFCATETARDVSQNTVKKKRPNPAKKKLKYVCLRIE